MTAVLHVLDRPTGGVPIALRTYIENSPPGFEHHILCPMGDDASSDVWQSVRATFHPLSVNHLHRIRDIRTLRKRLGFTVVHAHSSFSGVYVRLATSRKRTKIVHTPHCYAFERQDATRAATAAFRVIETALAWNTTLVAACSRGERDLAGSMSGIGHRTDYIPNVASLPPRLTPRTPRALRRVGMLGRVSAQKDPFNFIRSIQHLRTYLPDLQATWIGDGDSGVVAALRANHIEVTGWLSGPALCDALDELDLYLHSAAWEGFPIAVLDAHARSIPILVRSISAFVGTPASVTLDEGLSRLQNIGSSKDDFTEWARKNVDEWGLYLRDNTKQKQQSALERVWQAPTRADLT